MSLPRIITQVLITGTQILGRAFLEAYQQAALNSVQNAASASVARSLDIATRKTGMAFDEACNILNVQKDDLKAEEIIKKYETMFKQNDPATGGSLYLQSKVVRARERLELELGKEIGVEK